MAPCLENYVSLVYVRLLKFYGRLLKFYGTRWCSHSKCIQRIPSVCMNDDFYWLFIWIHVPLPTSSWVMRTVFNYVFCFFAGGCYFHGLWWWTSTSERQRRVNTPQTGWVNRHHTNISAYKLAIRIEDGPDICVRIASACIWHPHPYVAIMLASAYGECVNYADV